VERFSDEIRDPAFINPAFVLIGRQTSHGQNRNIPGLFIFPEFPANIKAAEFWQQHIKNDQVWINDGITNQGFGACRSNNNFIPFAAQKFGMRLV